MAQSSSLVLVVQLNYQYLLDTQTLALEDDVGHSYLLTRLSGDNKADGWRHWRLQLQMDRCLNINRCFGENASFILDPNSL